MVMGQFKELKINCDVCTGSGEITPEGNKCNDCNGKKVVNQKKVIEVSIDKGSPDGDKYIFHGEADEFPEKEAGDVVFIVSQQKHAVYKRKGADLLLKKQITVMEAMCGIDFVINFLDGTDFRVKSEEGQVIQPEQILTIEEKGMPFHKKSWQFGNLFIMFIVNFPDTITAE